MRERKSCTLSSVDISSSSKQKWLRTEVDTCKCCWLARSNWRSSWLITVPPEFRPISWQTSQKSQSKSTKLFSHKSKWGVHPSDPRKKRQQVLREPTLKKWQLWKGTKLVKLRGKEQFKNLAMTITKVHHLLPTLAPVLKRIASKSHRRWGEMQHEEQTEQWPLERGAR